MEVEDRFLFQPRAISPIARGAVLVLSWPSSGGSRHLRPHPSSSRFRRADGRGRRGFLACPRLQRDGFLYLLILRWVGGDVRSGCCPDADTEGEQHERCSDVTVHGKTPEGFVSPTHQRGLERRYSLPRRANGFASLRQVRLELQVFHQERPHIGGFLDQFARGLAGSVPSFRLDAS